MLTLAATNTIQGISGTATAITYTIFGMQLNAGTETYEVLAQGQLAASAGALYTVPSSTTTFIKHIILANATSSAVSSIILYVNGTAATNQITGAFTIPAYGVAMIDDDGLSITDQNGNVYSTASLIFSGTAPSPTTPGALSATGSSSSPPRLDHTHQSTGAIAALTSTSAGINSTETVVLNVEVPANFFQSGTTIRIYGFGTCTSSAANASNFRCRIGTAGTTSDTQIVTVAPTAATSGTNIAFHFVLLVTCRGSGSSTTVQGTGMIQNPGTTGVSSITNTVAGNNLSGTIDTTVANYIDFTYVAAASTTTCTFYNVIIEVVNM